jgi:serine/threonine protein kinase
MSLRFAAVPIFDIQQANILMSSHTPPRACLADFGFMTMVPDPEQPMSCSVQLEGGTMMFMSPELLFPSRFGLKDSVPIPEGDIYAFGLVIFQVCAHGRGSLLFSHSVQVLTGEIPFRGIRPAELGYAVVEGRRPEKPANASAIGFSDPLWDFVQRCWDGNMRLRPKIAEVVARLGEAVANWVRLTPPCIQIENVASGSKEPVSDSVAHCEFEILAPPSYFPLSNRIGLIFQSSPDVTPEGPIDS